MTYRLDHLMYGGADLDESIKRFAFLSGVTADRGGSHPGRGTRNALVSLGPGIYLELMAPDPAQSLNGTFGMTFVQIARPQIHTYIVKGEELERIRAKLAEFKIDSEIRDMTRKTLQGDLLRWRLVIPHSNPYGEFIPRFIDWMGTPHPSETSVSGCSLVSFEIGHPEADALMRIMKSLDFEVDAVSRSDAPFFLARMRTPKGNLTLTGA